MILLNHLLTKKEITLLNILIELYDKICKNLSYRRIYNKYGINILRKKITKIEEIVPDIKNIDIRLCGSCRERILKPRFNKVCLCTNLIDVIGNHVVGIIFCRKCSKNFCTQV